MAQATQEEIQAATSRAAEQDMAAVRRDKNQGMLIPGTQKGLVCLRYHKESKTYSITTQGMNPVELANGKKRDVKPVLMGLYVIVENESDV